jgi:hypothetical protein
MTQRKNEDCNENWEAEIAAYDAEREAEDKEFKRKYVIIDGSGNSSLTEEENLVFGMLLRGIPLSEIAGQAGIDEDEIAGLVEIIRAKLSISD